MRTRAAAFVVMAVIMVRPVPQDIVLIGFLAAIAIVSVIGWSRVPVPMVPGTERIFFGWLGLGLAGCTLAFVFRNQPISDPVALWIGVPILAYVIVRSLSEEGLAAVVAALPMAAMLSATLLILVVLDSQDILPFSADFLSFTRPDGYQATGGQEGLTEGRFYGTPSLLVAVPVLATGAVAPGVPHPWRWRVAAAIVVAAILVSGRRAALVTALVTPVIWWLLPRLSSAAKALRSRTFMVVVTGAAVIGVAAFVLGQDIGLLTSNVLSGFGAETNYLGTTENIRATQSLALLERWLESPLWGHGFSAEASYQRGGELLSTAQFENQYLMYLMNVGVIGAAWMIGLGMALWKLAKKALLAPNCSPYLAPLLTGVVALGLANASNPYLQSVANWWVVILTLAVTNTTLIKRVERQDIDVWVEGERRRL